MRKLTIILFLLSGLIIAETSSTFAQNGGKRKIAGIVKDENNEPLPTAAVVVKGTNTASITDFDGKFELTLDKNATTLSVSFIGYITKTVTLSDSKTYEIKMTKSAFNLDEVVVSGVAAETPRKKLAVTVARINAKEIKEVPASSAASSLQGKVPGVTVKKAYGTPGSGANIMLRGSTSFRGDQSPLVIVDGIMVQISLADMNSDDIESIEIVKGAAAASLYGSKAGSGVIVVTTKRGNKLKKDKFEITVRNEYGFSKLSKKLELSTHHPYKLAADDGDFGYTKYDGIIYDEDGNPDESVPNNNNRQLTDSAYADQPYALVKDHQDKIFKQGGYYTNYVSIGKNMGTSNLFLSFENNKEEGIIFNTEGYNRKNFRFNADTKVGKYIKFSTSNMLILSESDNLSGSVFKDVIYLSPDVNLDADNADGTKYNILPDPWSIAENPLYPLYHKENDNSKNSFLTNAKMEIKPFKELTINTKYTFEKFNKFGNVITPMGYLYGSGSNINGALYKSQYTSTSQTFQTTANYNKIIKNDYTVKVKGSYLFEDVDYYNFAVTGKEFQVVGINQFDNTDPSKADISSYEGSIKAINVFGIVDADYKNKYMISTLFRRDGSSLFGANERWQSYYRVAAAYRITEDIDIPRVQELKIRTSLGTSGQRPGFSYQYETWYISNGTVNKGILGNDDLKPSESKEIEVALDAQFFNKISFTASVSTTTTTDVFQLAPLASHMGGYSYQWRNVGTIKADVLELSLAYIAIKTKKTKLNFRLNFDKITQKITELNIPEYQTGSMSQFIFREGEAIGTVYGNKWVKSLDVMSNQLQTDEVIGDYVVNSDGYVIRKGTEGSTLEAPILLDANNDSIADKEIIALGTPDFNMSLSTNFSYKAFSFYMLLDWKQGGQIYNYTKHSSFFEGRAKEFDQSGKAEDQKKSYFYYQHFYNGSNLNDYFVENGTYLKLRELSVYYTYNLEEGSKVRNLLAFKSLKFGLIARNVLTFTHYSGYDPEVASGRDLANYSFDNFGYPNFRTFSASLIVKF